MLARRRKRTTLWGIAVIILLIAANAATGAARPSVGVVLGGGAARGFSHIGLLQALEEEGIPVDILVGTSMGSIVAGLYAAGFSTEQLEWMVQEIDLADLFSPFIPPKGGLLDTSGFERFLDQLTGGLRVEELEMPFYSVITNLITGESVALDHGPLSTAIVASMAIPGMFPPVIIDGEAYIDGGIKEPVPVLAARKAGADVVIAVDVRRELEEIDLDAILTNLQLTLYFLLDDNTEAQLAYADVIVSPEVHTSSYMEYHDAARFIDEGYRAAKAAIPEIKALLQEKDPTVVFVPQGGRDQGVDEDFRRRFEEALEAVRPAASRSWLRTGAAVTVETADGTYLDLGLGARLWAGRNTALIATYDHRRPIGGGVTHTLGGVTHTLGVGFEAGDVLSSFFVRKSPGDDGFSPGAGVKARWGGDAGLRLALAGEWMRTESAGDETRVDVAAGWAFPLERTGLWELAMLEPAIYVGVGMEGQFAEGVGTSRARLEGGYDFNIRLFGIYPLKARLALAYRSGDSPWVFSLRFGD